MIYLLMALFYGWACYELAKLKGHNKNLWLILGICFGLISMTIILCLNIKEDKDVL
jgi:hypothetical protein